MKKRYLNKVKRKPYDNLSHNYIRLNGAERNNDFSKSMWNKFLSSLKQSDIKYYPNLDELYDALAAHYDIDKEGLIIGDGSDRIIKYVFECFVEQGDEVITSNPSFPMYEVYTKLYNAKINKIDYKGLKVDLDRICNTVNESTAAIILSNPSSPIGDVINSKDLYRLITKAAEYDCLLIIDEAYIEFSDSAESFLKKVMDFENLIVIKTFSKAIGSAGVRFGFGYTNKELIKYINKFRTNHEITGLTMKWVLNILNHWDEIELYINHVKKLKQKLIDKCIEAKLDVVDGECNWIHVNNITDNLQLNTDNIILRDKCSIPNDNRNNWIRLCIPPDSKTIDYLFEIKD